MSSTSDELGGAPILTVLLVGQGPVVDRFSSTDDDGLAHAVAHATDGAVTLEITSLDPSGDTLLDSLAAVRLSAPGHAVAVLCFESDLGDRWPDDFESAKSTLTQGIRALKETGVRIIAVGVSTLDPSGPSPEATAAERTAHELGLALLELSVDEGISVLDTDRVVAELGGREHVLDFLRYSDTVYDRVVDAMVEILSDYGYFEPRPLLPQIGTRNR